MKINVRERSFELADSLREHTKWHLRFALGWPMTARSFMKLKTP